MTDRLKGLVVTFDKDIREDDAKRIIDAILMIKGVHNVATSIADHEDHMNRSRIRSEMEEKIYQVLRS